MLKKITNILFSTRLTAVLFLVFAAAMATGTFMDASSETSPTPYSREMIYNAWWFEAIMGLFVVNFVGNIFRYRLFRKEKWATLLFHLSFILILIGAFVTRYIGYEGAMHIREGGTSNMMLSSEVYLSAFIDGDYKIDGVPQRRNLAPRKLNLSDRLDPYYKVTTDYNEQEVTFEIVDFISNAEEGLVPSETGDEYLKIVEAGDGNRHDHWLKVGEVANIHNILFAVNKPTNGAINITYQDEVYSISAPFDGEYMRMADQKRGTFVRDSIQPLMLRSLYQMADIAFVIPEPLTKGTYGVVQAPKDKATNQNAIVVDVSSKNETKRVELLGGQGVVVSPEEVNIAGLKAYLSYGSKEIKLPFSITLNDFIADKYPGTEKGYSAYKSKVTVNESDSSFYDYDIYMNNILDQGGYRFFQSGFDPDEKGTILAVGHDLWGTWITYIGYFLLYLGLMAILFDRNSRFGSLKKQLDKIKKKKASLSIFLLMLLPFMGQAQHAPTEEMTKQKIDSVIIANAASKEHAAKFGELVLQDNGRMKPVNTFASELLRKISRENSYEGLDANQVFMSMIEFPRFWLEVPIIKLKRGNDSIRKAIGVPEETKKLALLDLIDEKGRNKLEPYLEAATSTNNPNQFQKDYIKAYENFYLLNQALSGSIFKVFPIKDDANNKWVSYPELGEANYKGSDSSIVRSILPYYFEKLREARSSGDYTDAEIVLSGIAKLQRENGSEVMPSERKIKTEILYNKVDIFNRIYKYFILIGFLMFVFIIMQIFKDGKTISILIKACKVIVWIFFALLTLGLISRWYVSGHAPWSDAYESVIYVGWATVFFGLAFGRKSDLTVASTAFVAAIIFWVAHQNWLDPSIANLQPVLDSYWLMIHVAVIVGSYGPFTLAMILGATSLLLMILTTENNKVKMDLSIKEITIITEMALTVGLVMLAIGNFLGGQWANESWGRYWGWDPKETWALISIMIYAFVLHMRLVPGLRGRWFFNVMAIFAYSSIMMTYFGVNFYLTGLHSYASGDKPITPSFVMYALLFFGALCTFAYFRHKKFYK